MATSPTSAQLKDAYGGEVSLVHAEMEPTFRGMVEVQSEYIRFKEMAGSRWIRMRTGESVESVSGVHSDHMVTLIDEASGIRRDIHSTAMATMTNKHKIMLMLSNPVSRDGIFADMFLVGGMNALLLHFDGFECPIFDLGAAEETERIYGKDSAEYQVSVRGNFPAQIGSIGDWYRFFPDNLIEKALYKDDIAEENNAQVSFDTCVRVAMGVDVAGSGGDSTEGYIRSSSHVRQVFEQATSDDNTIAGAIIGTLNKYPAISPLDVFIDGFGVGMNVAQKVSAQAPRDNPYDVNGVNVGYPVDAKVHGEVLAKRYINVRAAMYDALRIWLNNGGKIPHSDKIEKQLKSLYAKRTSTQRLQIMSKKEMRENSMCSPDDLDAIALSFYEDFPMIIEGRHSVFGRRDRYAQVVQDNGDFDRFSSIPS